MTKTKKQLRAEAVERLEQMRNARSLVEFTDEFNNVCDWLLDLLTDDEPEERTKTEQNGVIAEVDTREKLEVDFVEYVSGAWARGFDAGQHDDTVYYIYRIEDVRALLDRQAAITEREVGGTLLRQDERIAELQAKVDELQFDYDAMSHDYEMAVEECDELTDQKRTLVAYVEADGTKYREEPSTQVFDHSETRGVMPDGVEWKAKAEQLQDENARLRTCMESDKEQHDEILAENAALEAELKLARGELKQMLNNHAQAEQRIKRKEQELDRKLAQPPDERLKELYELAQRNYERKEAESANLRKVLDGIAKAARYRKLPKEEE